MRLIPIAVAAGLLLAAGASQSAAYAATLTFSTHLQGSNEVPPNNTSGSGEVKATLNTDTKEFAYNVTYSGLTGPAVAAHFHGPAAPGANAPPVIVLTTLTSPIFGSATLTDAQVADLKGGKWYFNVHTAAHKGGEIRGQLPAAQ
jgi:hypothetical protein